jgi:hypothetical protein
MIFLPPFLRSKQLQNASERATTTWADLGAEKEVSHNFSSDHDLYHTYTLPFHWNGVKLAFNLNFIKLVKIHRSEI